MGKMAPTSIVSIPKFQQTGDKVFHGVQALKAVSRFRHQKNGEPYNPLGSLNEDSDDDNDYAHKTRTSFSHSLKMSGFRRSGQIVSNNASSERITAMLDDKKPGTTSGGLRLS